MYLIMVRVEQLAHNMPEISVCSLSWNEPGLVHPRIVALSPVTRVICVFHYGPCL